MPRLRWLAVLVFFGGLCLCLQASDGQQAREPAPALARLKSQIQAFAKTIPGQVGVAVKHLESGQEIQLRRDEKFPMASTFKVPLLVEVLAQEKAGKFALADEIVLEKKHQHLGSGSLKYYQTPGVKLSVRNFCELMMTISDNSATDWLLDKVGKDNVNARLKEAGISGIRVDRSCQELILDYLGYDPKEHAAKSTEELVRMGLNRDASLPEVAAARQKYYSDGRDSSTPAAMNRLLERIFKAEVLDRERCDLILAIMKRCQTGDKRLLGLLPPGTVIAHKTGSVGTTVNDVGILYLPDDAGHVVISVFTKDPDNDNGLFDREKHERVIAQIARSVYDYFLFTAPATPKNDQ